MQSVTAVNGLGQSARRHYNMNTTLGSIVIEQASIDSSNKFVDVYWSADTPNNWYEFMHQQSHAIAGYLQTQLDGRVTAMCTDRMDKNFYRTQLVIHAIGEYLEN